MSDRFTTRKATISKRRAMTCKVYQVKVDHSHLSQPTTNYLERLFREAKWFYNYCLSQTDINDADTTLKTIQVKIGDDFEDRELTTLRSHFKQGIKTRLFGSLASLAALKKNGHKVGRLKYKKEVNSIPLKEHNNTYYVRGNKVRLQGMKRWMRVNGLDQIPGDAEIANATLVRKNGDYYLHITTYTEAVERIVPEASIGIDFGCETQLTFSNGVKLQFQVEPSKRLRRLDRKIMRKRRAPSNNRVKDQAKRQKEYEKLTNQRKDIRHKVVSAITKNYKYVCFQDESIHAWHSGNHGKKVQFSGIGSILADLRSKAATPLVVDKFFPSTQLCPGCGSKRKLSLWERTYTCGCGYSADRDVKSAVCIEREGLRKLPVERRESTPGEISPSAFEDTLSKINGVLVSKVRS